MDNRLGRGSCLHGRSPSLPIERTIVRVSISTALSRRSPEIVRTPPSPAKSSVGAIIEDSQFTPFASSQPNQIVPPQLPEIDRHPPLRHPQHDYRRHTVLGSRSEPEEDTNNRISQFSANSHSSNSGKSSTQDGPLASSTKNAIGIQSEKSPLTKVNSVLEKQRAALSTSNSPSESCVENNDVATREQNSTASGAGTDQCDITSTMSRHSSNATASRPHSGLEELHQPYGWSERISERQEHYQYDVKRDSLVGAHAIALQALDCVGQDLLEPYHAGRISSSILEPYSGFLPIIPGLSRLESRNPEFIPSTALKFRSISSPAQTGRLLKLSMVHPVDSVSQDTTPKYVLTPYPFLNSESESTGHLNATRTPEIHLRQFVQTKPRLAPPILPALPVQDSTVLLSVRRRAARNSQQQLMTSITVPNKRTSFVSTLAEKQLAAKNFTSNPADFDDAALFVRMRAVYCKELLGSRFCSRLWRRWCSARVLVAIIVVRHGSLGSWNYVHDMPQGYNASGSSRLYINKSSTQLSESRLDEECLWSNFRQPKRALSQHHWVRWIHETARRARAANTEVMPQDRAISEAHFELIEDWSVWRIVVVGSGVLVVTAASLLLWTFLGGGSGALGPKVRK